jgi:predicted CoA-binding protein
MESDGLPDELIKDVLTRYRRVVVVGASREPSKPANYVPRFLQRHGYEVVPVNPFADEVLKVKPKVFWMQEGIYSREAAELLSQAGITVVWNRCMMKEHNRLFGSKPLIPLGK